MEKSTAIHMLEIVADGLKELRRQVVFVGGATVALYVDDPAVANPRPTDDVDCTVEISSRREYYQLEKEVRKLGFKNEAGPGGPLCRWTYSGVTVDILPSDGKVLGFTNSWYPAGIAHSEKVSLPNKTDISIFTLPFFLASKFEAFHDRGKGAPRLSSDFEDIVFVLDGCRSADTQINAASEDVRKFLSKQYRKMSTEPNFTEAITAHLANERNQAARATRILNILSSIK